MKKAFVFPDIHIPYHSKKSLDVALQVCSTLNPDEIVILGDALDFYAIHGHGKKHPKISQYLETELIEGNLFLDQLDKYFPKAKKVFLEGNHEYRLERFLINNAPQLFGIVEIKKLLNMKNRPNWTFFDYKNTQKHRILDSNLYARHEPFSTNPKTSAQKSATSLVYGHVHKIEVGYSNSLSGKGFVHYCPGWLGDENRKEVFNYLKYYSQWQQGFSVVYTDGYKFFYDICEIKKPNYETCFNGKVYRP